MPVNITCPSCRTKIKSLPDAYVGKLVKCPKCAQNFTAKADPPEAPGTAASPRAPQQTAPRPPAQGPTPTAKPSAPAAPRKPAAPAPVAATRKPASPAKNSVAARPAPKKEPEEVEVTEAVEEEEVVVDEAADEEEVVVDEAADEEEVVVDEAADEDEPSLRKGDPWKGHNLDKDFIAEVKKELTKGERVVWVGRPSVKLLMSNAKIAVVVGAIVVPVGLGIAVGGFLVGSSTALTIMLIVGLGFAGIGTLALFAPAFTKRSLPIRAVYILTTRRCLTYDMALAKYATRGFRSYAKGKVSQMQRKNSMRQQGAGDLIFDYEYEQTGGGNPDRPGSSSVQKIPKGFLMVEKVTQVEKLIRETLFGYGQ